MKNCLKFSSSSSFLKFVVLACVLCQLASCTKTKSLGIEFPDEWPKLIQLVEKNQAHKYTELWILQSATLYPPLSAMPSSSPAPDTDWGILTDFENLRSLTIRVALLSSLPDEILQLKNLLKLDVSLNPEISFEQLIKLKGHPSIELLIVDSSMISEDEADSFRAECPSIKFVVLDYTPS